MATLGEKVRFFRKREGVSQLELENRLGFSSGMISRIESGVVNPTKETLTEISSGLRLNVYEQIYFTTPEYFMVSDSQIDFVIETIKNFIDSSLRICYVIDNKRCIRYLNLGARNILAKAKIDYRLILGRTVLENLFDENLGIKSNMSETVWERVASRTINSLNRDLGFLIDFGEYEYFSQLQSNPLFMKMWYQYKDVNMDLVSDESRKISFDVFGINLSFYFSAHRIEVDPRFELVEYLPTNPALNFLQKLLT